MRCYTHAKNAGFEKVSLLRDSTAAIASGTVTCPDVLWSALLLFDTRASNGKVVRTLAPNIVCARIGVPKSLVDVNPEVDGLGFKLWHCAALALSLQNHRGFSGLINIRTEKRGTKTRP